MIAAIISLAIPIGIVWAINRKPQKWYDRRLDQRHSIHPHTIIRGNV